MPEKVWFNASGRRIGVGEGSGVDVGSGVSVGAGVSVGKGVVVGGIIVGAGVEAGAQPLNNIARKNNGIDTSWNACFMT